MNSQRKNTHWQSCLSDKPFSGPGLNSYVSGHISGAVCKSRTYGAELLLYSITGCIFVHLDRNCFLEQKKQKRYLWLQKRCIPESVFPFPCSVAPMFHLFCQQGCFLYTLRTMPRRNHDIIIQDTPTLTYICTIRKVVTLKRICMQLHSSTVNSL